MQALDLGKLHPQGLAIEHETFKVELEAPRSPWRHKVHKGVAEAHVAQHLHGYVDEVIATVEAMQV